MVTTEIVSPWIGRKEYKYQAHFLADMRVYEGANKLRKALNLPLIPKPVWNPERKENAPVDAKHD